MKSSAIIVTAMIGALGLGGCSAASLAVVAANMSGKFFSETATAETAKQTRYSDRTFLFDITSETPQDELAENVAAHALRCWVRDDPTYRVNGPFEEEDALDVALIYLGDDPAKPREFEALRLSIPEADEGRYAVAVSGALATEKYRDRLLDGLRKAADGSQRCN